MISNRRPGTWQISPHRKFIQYGSDLDYGTRCLIIDFVAGEDEPLQVRMEANQSEHVFTSDPRQSVLALTGGRDEVMSEG